MKFLHKFRWCSFLIFSVMIVVITGRVNAQSSKHAVQVTTIQDNFTSFTPQKFYTDHNKLLFITPAKYRSNPDFGKSFIDKHFEDSNKWYERINKRTLKSRTYVNINDTGNILIQYGYDNLNYTDENGWLRAVDIKLKPSAGGWCATQQETPVYLYKDASTALSLGNGQLMQFNKNVKFGANSISTTDYTVGDNGIYIKNAVSNTDKIIRFGRGRVETDYRINKPLNLTGDLTISEDIILPAGFTISENTNYDADIDQPGALIVKDAAGKIVAELKTPLCYDSNKGFIVGSYHISQQAGGFRLEVNVPSTWLNNSLRRYPVTIDPAVVGFPSFWPPDTIYSCLNTLGTDTGGMDTASIIITIPGNITVTDFYVQSSYYAALVPLDSATMWFTTNCNDSVYTDFLDGGGNYFPGLATLFSDFTTIPGASGYLGCYPPSCNSQTFKFTYSLVRMAGGSGCNATYVYYDPFAGFPFAAYVEGYTAQSNTDTSGAGWAISPNPSCGNSCTLTLNINTVDGVPPYTITHPWAAGSVTYGRYNDTTAVSSGTVNLTLTIPGCTPTACVGSTISVPPPTITDACGNTVGNLTAITVKINPAPDVVFTPNAATICSDSNISISLSSCVPGSTFSWNGSDGANGSNIINDAPVNNGTSPETVTYTATSTASGCTSNPTQMQVIVNPLPVISVTPPSPSICSGKSVGLTASGALTYTWSPSAGLNTTTGDSVVASTSGNTYTVFGTIANGCIGKTSVTVNVALPPVIIISLPAPTVCIGSNATLTAQGASTYTWQPTTGLSSNVGSSVIVTPTATTTYTITGIDSVGCVDSTNVLVTLATLPKVSFFMTIPNYCQTQQVQFKDTLPLEADYLWSFGDGATGGSSDPIHTYVLPGNYTVKLLVTDSVGCTDTSSEDETIQATGVIAVPNAFTPSANGDNNYFAPHMLCESYSNYNLEIFNRWGQVLFQTNDLSAGWNGRYNGVLEPVGVYIYYIEFNCGNCQVLKKGNITVLQ
jgi:gliding motility-associated-like protein